jgi:hypothetical protein
MLIRDWLTIPGIAAGTTRSAAGSVVMGGLIARSDRNTGNPNLAAAGSTRRAPRASSTTRSASRRSGRSRRRRRWRRTRSTRFRTVNNQVRSYGFWTLADLDVLPQWWDMSGSRTMMAIRAREGAVAEELLFGQIAADGAFLDRYKGALAGELAEFQRIGAVYGTAESRATASTCRPRSTRCRTSRRARSRR